MKRIIFTVPGLFTCLFLYALPVKKTMKRLPDTGQTTSYTTTNGEDADYTINPPVYILNGDGTITDTVTGLIWQKTDGGEMTIDRAIIYCDTLTLGGYTDWRLPDCHELFSILNHDKVNPALDGNYFTTSAAEYWWSSQRQANDTNKVWVTNAGGGVGNHPRTETISAGGTKKFHVRAVRDAGTPPSVNARFTPNPNGTVNDAITGLVWQQQPNADTLTWEQALSYADTLSLGGNNDWRLPNIKELQSINDETLINPSLNTSYFTVSGSRHYWSSTSLPNQTTSAWYLDTQFGLTTYASKTSKLYLLCVRGGYTSTQVNRILRTGDLYIYPNPLSNTLHIKYTGIIKKLSILNMMGIEVMNITNPVSAIDISSLLVGNYFLLLQDETGNIVRKKIVKEY
jgi:hypothetical protein